MANPEHVEIVRQGANAIEKWRKEHPDVKLDLTNADLERLNLCEANLSNSILEDAEFSYVNLERASFEGSYLPRSMFSGCNLAGINLNRAHLGGAGLGGANLSGMDLRSVTLYFADLGQADLSGANLSGQWFRENNLICANLSRADISDTTLHDTNLCSANLSGANLSKSRIRGTRIIDANLSRADLSEASLVSAILNNVNLEGAVFNGVTIENTEFCNLDLSGVEGLETVKHRGPSTIGIDTLYKSRGKIPEGFLRGCGVPDALIAYLPSLLGAEEAIQFYSCFISYSHTDEEFAKRLHSRMRDEHLRVWYAPEDIKSGQKIHEQIERAIQVNDRLLLVLSDASIRSEWVATEIHHARQREVKERRQVLFPIRLVPFEAIKEWKCFDAETGKDMAREIREYFIPDFSDWKDQDSFEAGFKRLMEDLKAESVVSS